MSDFIQFFSHFVHLLSLTSIYEPLKDTNWTSNKPLIGTDLHGTLSALAKPLPDFTSLWGMLIMSVEPLQAFTSWRAAKCSYQTFTGLHKPLYGSNCTCRTPYESLREANSTYQISNWFYNLFQGANCTQRTTSSLHQPFQDANFYLTHSFLNLVSGRSSSWQTVLARVGGDV